MRASTHRSPIALRAAVALLAVALAGSAVHAAEVRMLEMGEREKRVWLEMVVALEAPPPAVFAVITDYENLHRLHRRIRESRVLRRVDARTSDIYTLLRGCVAALFCRSIRRVERVTEHPPGELVAEVLPDESDLSYGAVRWRLEGDGEGSLLHYTTEIEPEFWVPHFFGDRLLASSLRRTTAQMIERVEDLARERHAGGGEPRDTPMPSGEGKDTSR